MKISNRDISGVFQPASIRPPRATLIENSAIRIATHLIENKRQTQILIENFSPRFRRLAAYFLFSIFSFRFAPSPSGSISPEAAIMERLT